MQPISSAARMSRGGLLRLAAVTLGGAMFAAAVVGTLHAGRAAAVDQLDRSLRSEAQANAQDLREYFDRASTITLLLAHDTALTQFVPQAGTASTGVGAPNVRAAAARQASDAMAYLEKLYPGRISEACLIDRTGTEFARVVKGAVAPASELSTQEASAPFFAPTLALPRGRVLQSAPYRSPDTGEWVIANSTPLTMGAGRPWGLLHFEVSLRTFQPTGDRRTDPGGSLSVVETKTGRVVLRNGTPVLDGRAAAVPAGLRRLLATRDGASATLGGRRLAVFPLRRSADNQNSWAVVVSAPTRSLGSGWRSIGPAPVGMALSALLLLAVAGLSLRSRHRELRSASLTDALTGLPNRRLLADRLEQALLLARRRGTVCGVLLLDLDRFKEVNDTLGHHCGDELLRLVAARLQGVFRESETVSRLGGDEFAVLLPDVADEAAAVALARRCSEALQEQFVVEGALLSVEVSIGLALGPVHGSDGGALLRAADVAMYQAKEHRTGVVLYAPGLDVTTPTRLALPEQRRRALQEDQLVLDTD